MKWPAFDYRCPTSLAELWEIMATSGDEVRLLAGGQSLLAALAFRLSTPKLLVDITRIPELRGIALTPQGLRIGALTRHVELGRDPLVVRHAPLLAEAVPLIAHAAIRNRGTLGGSLAQADPAAELPACAVALDATLHLLSARGERRLKAEAFFTGLFRTALAPGEIIAAVEVAPTGPDQRTTILEITRRSGDYAMAGIAAVLSQDAAGIIVAARLTFFGVGEKPLLAQRANAALSGRLLDQAAIAAAAEALEADLDPPQDLHGPPTMKRHLARVLLRRALSRFLSQEIAA